MGAPETERNLANKISRGESTAAFFVQSLPVATQTLLQNTRNATALRLLAGVSFVWGGRRPSTNSSGPDSFDLARARRSMKARRGNLEARYAVPGSRETKPILHRFINCRRWVIRVNLGASIVCPLDAP